MKNTLNKMFYPYFVAFIISLILPIVLIVIKRINSKGKSNLREKKLKLIGICAILCAILITGISIAVSYENTPTFYT